MKPLSSLSTEYVLLPISAKDSGVPIDPTAADVEMAFLEPAASPGVADWKLASWETDPSENPIAYMARCLVGPGGLIALAKGKYRVWAKLTGAAVAPEEPVVFSEVLLEVT